MGNETEFETRNGREMGNETELETRNGRKWKRDDTRYFIFQQKTRKNRGKNEKNRGKNTKKQGGKNRKKQKITRNTETRFQRGSGKC